MKKNCLKTAFFFSVLVAMFFEIAPATAAQIDQKLYADLLDLGAGKEILTKHNVPGVMMPLRHGESVNSVCRNIDSFRNNDYYRYRDTISLINRLEPFAEKGAKHDLSTNVENIFIPLDFSAKPEILPAFIQDLARHEKFILIDVGLECIGLYEKGWLAYIFPISSGKSGTPTRRFTILSKETDHYSRLYGNAWMPFSLRLFGNYFLHGGILPGLSASHGCIRIELNQSQIVFNWTRVGTPGKIVRTQG